MYSGMERKFGEADLEDVETYDDFFDKNPGMAKLVYCRDEEVEKVKEAAKKVQPKADIKTNVVGKSGLHSNTVESVMIVTDKRLMRGFDYRCEKGIAMVLASSFDHERALLQAMGRVGRMNDKFKRYKLASAEALYPENGNKNILKAMRPYKNDKFT